MANGDEPWESVGTVALHSALARPTFGFANPDRISADFTIEHGGRRASAGSDTESLRLNPYGSDQAEPPDHLAGAIVVSSLTEPAPSDDENLYAWLPELAETQPPGIAEADSELRVTEVPLEIYREDGVVVAARLGYLTWLLHDMRRTGTTLSTLKVERGTWVLRTTLDLPFGHCIALDPHTRGTRTHFEVKAGRYVAEVFTFDDPELGYYECDSGLRIRWVGE